jgi:3D (Asp-Asp-Asp) domain-containing protein
MKSPYNTPISEGFQLLTFIWVLWYTVCTIEVRNRGMNRWPGRPFFYPYDYLEHHDCNRLNTSSTGCPAKANSGPEHDVKGIAMYTRKHLLIAVSVFITIAISTTLTAQAGILDFLKSRDIRIETSGSFDSLYASVLVNSQTETKDKLVMNETTLIPATSPMGGNGYDVTRRIITVQVSGYNSEVAQTDDSPFIGSAGTYMRDGVVAANIIDAYGRNIPHFTKIRFKNCGNIPNDKIFSVEDRLNKRYTKNVDVWFAHKADALKLGRRTCQIEVL